MSHRSQSIRNEQAAVIATVDALCRRLPPVAARNRAGRLLNRAAVIRSEIKRVTTKLLRAG